MDGECILMASPLFSISRKYENETKYTLSTTRLWPSFICINSTISWNVVKKDREFHDSRDDTSLHCIFLELPNLHSILLRTMKRFVKCPHFFCVWKKYEMKLPKMCVIEHFAVFLWNSKLMVQNANGSIKAFVWLWYKPFSLYEMPNVP